MRIPRVLRAVGLAAAIGGRQALFVSATSTSGQRVGTVAVPVFVAQQGQPTPIPH